MTKKKKESGKTKQSTAKQQTAAKKKSSGFRAGGWIVLAIAVLAAAGIAIFLVLKKEPAESPETAMSSESVLNTAAVPETSPGNPRGKVNVPVEIDATNQNMAEALKPEEVRENEIAGFTDVDFMPLGDLGEGLAITRAGSYTGRFVEDGRNLPTENVLAVLVTNRSDRFVEYAQIVASSGTGTAVFQLTSLPAGQSVLVMEKNNRCYEDGMTFNRTLLQRVTKPDREFSLYPEVFGIKAADGVVNLINRTETAYPGKIAVYFKNAQDGIYIGGITYSRTLENGIPAGGIAQFMADNYTVAGSELVFIEYEH